MKTFIYENIEALKRLNKALDFKARLCGRSWWVFNDEGVKETFIFQSNGEILITTSGIVSRGKWEYLSINQSIIIKYDKIEYMLKAAYGDDNLLALNLDGTKEISVMIDENNKQCFLPGTFSEVCMYLAEKEKQKTIEIEEAKDTYELKSDQWIKYRKLHQDYFESINIYSKKDSLWIYFLVAFVFIAVISLIFTLNSAGLIGTIATAFSSIILMLICIVGCVKFNITITTNEKKIKEIKSKNQVYDYDSFISLPLKTRIKLIS